MTSLQAHSNETVGGIYPLEHNYPLLSSIWVNCRPGAEHATLFTQLAGKNRWERITREQLLHVIATAATALRHMEEEPCNSTL